jgi:hypothetical protein
VYLNQNSAWAALLTFLVLDCGVSFLSLAAILSRPLDLVAPNHHQSDFTAASADAGAGPPSDGHAEALLQPIVLPPTDEEQEDTNHVQDDSWRPLTPTQSTVATSPIIAHGALPHVLPPINEILDLTHGDTAITVHTVVFFLCLVSSILSDNLATFLQESDSVATMNHIVLFLLLNALENFLYCAGILIMVVSYRTTALQVWHLYHTMEDIYHHLSHTTFSPDTTRNSAPGTNTIHANTSDAQASLTILHRCLATYEQIFDRTECLSAQTTPIVLCIVSLVALEMASTVTDVFEEKHFNIDDIGHLAMLRLLLVLSALILQVALAAADVIYASERLAEVLARCDTYWRLAHAQAMTGTITTGKATALLGDTGTNDGGGIRYGSTDTTMSTNQFAALAAVCKAFGDRARSHPVRLRVSWFHLETEWSLGLAFLVVTIMLTIIGIKLPGGE